MTGVAALADVLAIEAAGCPDDLPSSTYEAIARGAAINPDAPALSFFLSADRHQDAEVWTYRDLMQRVTQAANAFHGLGVGPDDVVSYVLPNLPETHFTIWGGQAAGVVAAFNPLLEPSALATLLAAANTKVLVTLAPFPGVDLWSRVQTILDKVTCLEHLVLVNLSDRLPGGRKSRQVDEGVRAAVPAQVQVHDFQALLEREPASELRSGRRIADGDRSSCFCTGGTTGLPKIAVRRHGNEVANAWSLAQFLGDAVGPGTNFFCGLPLFHVNGVLVTGLLPFSVGAHVVLGTPQGYRGDGVVARFWEIVEHHKINFFSAVPTLYTGLMQYPVGERDISSLQYGICGAAPMPVEVFRTFQERTGLKILEGYGLTEGTCVSSVNPTQGERRIGSIGLRLPGQDMKAVMLDDEGRYDRDCGVDEVGELVIAGPNVFEGYLAQAHNDGIWLDCGDGRRWFNTGDLGRRDADGYFWLTGRRKELIIRGGHNIDPATIEEPLHQHPDVQIAAAVGRPDVYAGELPVAYVQLKPGSAATEADLAEFVRTRIGERAAVPKFIRIVDQVPLTGVGKIFKPALKHLEIRQAVTEALESEGLSAAKVGVVDVPEQGLLVTIVLDRGQSEAVAQAVMGRFSFRYVIDWRE